jgi:hypothetical protein
MKTHSFGGTNPSAWRFVPWGLGLAVQLSLGGSLLAAPRVVFETGFEQFEGYKPEADLVGQNGWISFGQGGNGILAAGVAGFQGQTAYIGFQAPPASQTDPFNVWRPVNLKPVGAALPVIQFTVSMQIEDSTTAAPYFDDFRWSAYNSEDHRFFTLDFDNESQTINFILDDASGNTAPPIRPTGFAFQAGQPYDVAMTMDFARNLWSAKINDVVVVNAQPITSRGAKLTLGDIDAVWAIRTPGKPGDNYMVFDDYKIVATDLVDIPPELVALGPLANTGAFVVRVLGEPGVTYTLEATSDFTHWEPVATGVAQSPGGYVDLQDTTAKFNQARYYRAQSQP